MQPSKTKFKTRNATETSERKKMNWFGMLLNEIDWQMGSTKRPLEHHQSYRQPRHGLGEKKAFGRTQFLTQQLP